MTEKLFPYFIAVIVLSIIGEAWYSYRTDKGLYDKKDTWTSIGFGLLGVVTRLVTKGLSLSLWFVLYKLSPFKIETTVLTIVILFLLNEFVYYWFHRISHEVRFFWATHVNHHSSMKMNFSTAARTPFMNAVYHTLFWIPLPLLGFHPADILAVEVFSFFFAFLQHTTIVPKLGFLEWFMNTPSHHRVHHATNTQYLDKNYGNVLIIFDRLFGTFEEEKEKPVFGLTKNVEDRSFINIIFHEWKDIVVNGYRKQPKND
ncbi:MAG: sterol desaturase family protein [Bacteroidetes bacterium]|nr:MAG: sterol desaturase family protein [Bacteroidota bacterium]